MHYFLYPCLLEIDENTLIEFEREITQVNCPYYYACKALKNSFRPGPEGLFGLVVPLKNKPQDNYNDDIQYLIGTMYFHLGGTTYKLME